MVCDDTLYKILNIPTNADQNTIKKAFRKLSLKWHPDRNLTNNKEATKKFQEISKAYSILSDPEKKMKYDRFGLDFAQNQGGPSFDPNDIFSHFFGNKGGNPFQQQASRVREEHIIKTVNVTLEQLYNEETISIQYEYKTECKICKGTGNKNKKKDKCIQCDGKGKSIRVIRMGPMIKQIVQTCAQCKGSGEYVMMKNRCLVCHGKGCKMNQETFQLDLKKEYDDDISIRVSNKGHQIVDVDSDLIIRLSIQKHPIYTKIGKHLVYNLYIEFYQSLFGFSKQVHHLDKSILTLELKGPSQHNDIKVIPDKGFYDPSTHKNGNIFIKINIKPFDIHQYTQKEIELLKTLLSKMNPIEIEQEKEIQQKIKDNRLKAISLKNTNVQWHNLKEKLQSSRQKNSSSYHHPRMNMNMGMDDDDDPQQCVHQ